MFVNANELPSGSTLYSDVCVVGAGAAGITLAKEFLSHGAKVILLESGGLDYDPNVQVLNEGKSLGLPYETESSRLRYFGGTTGHWGGAILRMDDTNFIARDWLPGSGWPFELDQLVPYYKRAEKVFGVEGRMQYGRWNPLEPSASSFLGESFKPGTGVTNPVRFGSVFRADIKNSANVTCVLYATLLQIETNETGVEVSSLQVQQLEGGTFDVKARSYVIATGGLENARILLLSNKKEPAGIGNHHGHVGRYFQEHISFWRSARIILNNEEQARKLLKPTWFSFTEKFLMEHQVLHANMGLVAADAPAISSFERVYGRLRRWIVDQEPRPMSLRYWAEKGIQPFDLTVDAEQSPNPASRVTLAPETDRFGQRKLALNWRLSELDRDNIRLTLQLLGAELVRRGIGRLWIGPHILSDQPFDKISYGWHHCGTTRMSVEPRDGVVDPDCRVHGIHNLYIAGSSVFPTNGRANPTFTIVALAIRLADKIKKELA